MQQPHALRQRPVHPRPARPEPACAHAGPAAHSRAEQPGGPDHRLRGRLPPRACCPKAERRLRAPGGLLDAGAPAPPGNPAAHAVCGARCPAPFSTRVKAVTAAGPPGLLAHASDGAGGRVARAAGPGAARGAAGAGHRVHRPGHGVHRRGQLCARGARRARPRAPCLRAPELIPVGLPLHSGRRALRRCHAFCRSPLAEFGAGPRCRC